MTEHQNPTPANPHLSPFFALLNLNEFANALFSNVYLATANKKIASLRHKRRSSRVKGMNFVAFD
jgi:hypothetical protein|tara:strand:+ start:1012 stop:1206 length:195 start_codon:yes stop_codon:yes gene_type:complete